MTGQQPGHFFLCDKNHIDGSLNIMITLRRQGFIGFIYMNKWSTSMTL
jgi:hypothetical protein